MENPEEVLQALDEFQKMRPSEIPRELEDYLCWVAKTGDPVYQWSLIKALFREKLMRVMTEFYENCPTLDLTPCPNVEQFNYDTMKSNLLERLESFANAPFTVQRICELLTTPRKEYNRIDKFMRAVEKNILVVSTREPGPYGRRSENGDNLVNGSVEDETSHHGQSSNEVEMENWVKDCTITTAASVSAGENEDMSVENGLNTSIKTAFEKQERIESQLSAVDTTASSFVTSTTDFSETTAVTTPVSVQEPTTVVQNLTTANHEATAIVGDVSDAIMNEDTSSQPSLELESDDNDSNDSKKLQTTFQAKDFSLDELKAPKTYSEALKGVKSEESIEITEPTKECNQLTEASYSSDKLLVESTDDSENSEKTDNLHDSPVIASEAEQIDTKLVTEPEISEKSESKSDISIDNLAQVNDIDLDTKKDEIEENVTEPTETTVETKCDTKINDELKAESVVKEVKSDTDDSPKDINKEASEEVETEVPSDATKPIVEEPLVETADSSDATKTDTTELTIEETSEDVTKVTKTLVPDPIPIIEEPKDTETVAKDWDSTVSVTEVSNEVSQDDTSTEKNGLEPEASIASDQVEEDKMIVSGCEEISSNKEATESMDVDNEGSITSAQLDEPMEQETTEPMNS